MRRPYGLPAGPLGLARADADLDAQARALVETGLLNWSGPATFVLVVSSGGVVMAPETAQAAVDFAFATPRPAIGLEISDEDGRGWPAAWLAVSYARRLAEWRRRGLTLTVRAAAPPAPARAEFLAAHRAAVALDVRADGAPDSARLFPAPRARVVVGPRARGGEVWADALAAAGVASVRWEPARATLGLSAARRFAAFASAALARMIDVHETSDLRDERAIALLAARPWEVPGLDLLEQLAIGPDGRVFSSEEGLLRAAEGDDSWLLGAAGALRFEALPATPLARAVAASAWRPAHPFCADCPYRGACAVPASARGGLAGSVPDSLHCLWHTALLTRVFSHPDREKCFKALDKWGVDISRLTC